VTQVQQIAERAVLVPVGASLLVRENLVSTVKDLATKYGTRASVERELKRYERRGASARNRFERQVRRTRTKFERELRQRRTTVERTITRQTGIFSAQVDKLVSSTQSRIGSLS
jgi:prefoldin subunit 5